MTKLTKNQIAAFARLSDAQLQANYDAVGTRPEHRVQSGKSKGQIRANVLRHADNLYAEISRRKEAQQ